MTIFVSIASYCDPILVKTVKSLVDNADRPDELVLGIVEQADIRGKDAIDTVRGPAKLRYVHVLPVDSRGVVWARASVNLLYGGEDYFFQIDAHMVFSKGWDTVLKTQLLAIPSKKAIISGYPHSFTYRLDGSVEAHSDGWNRTGGITDYTNVTRPKPERLITDDQPSYLLKVEATSPGLVLGNHISGAFLFTRGAFLLELPYDSTLYFHGEEHTLSLRAYTLGWDVYHTNQQPLLHIYAAENDTRTRHHTSEAEAARAETYVELENRSRERARDLYFQRKPLGVYGLGAVRTREEYAKQFGIDFINKRFESKYQEEYDF